MNCKPGDLAIIVKAIVSDNIGKIVRVGGFYREDERFGPLWSVQGDNISNVVHLENLSARNFDPRRKLYCPDDWLRPITGLPLNEQIEDEVTA